MVTMLFIQFPGLILQLEVYTFGPLSPVSVSESLRFLILRAETDTPIISSLWIIVQAPLQSLLPREWCLACVSFGQGGKRQRRDRSEVCQRGLKWKHLEVPRQAGNI